VLSGDITTIRKRPGSKSLASLAVIIILIIASIIGTEMPVQSVNAQAVENNWEKRKE
jgi:hypothetical protein